MTSNHEIVLQAWSSDSNIYTGMALCEAVPLGLCFG